jgi:ABC-type branched-subunit amino acid transport system permease subunit
VPLWNLLGLLLLANIVTIAIAATPVFHAFGPDHLNTWVSRSPFVLLPSVLVMAALFGHVVVLRSLRMRRRGAAAQRLQSSASE